MKNNSHSRDLGHTPRALTLAAGVVTCIRFELRRFALAAFGMMLAASAAHADEVDGLITFTAGTPARASEVNDNFAAVKTAVDGTHADIVALQQALAALQDALTAQATRLTALENENATLSSQLAATEAKVAALETENDTLTSQLDGVLGSQVMALDPYLTVTAGAQPRVLLSGVNLQIVNGLGATDTINGLGNLIVGYDEENTFLEEFCSDGEMDRDACLGSGGSWSNSHKTGSHYLVAGSANSYSQFGGIVAGTRNASTGPYASVTGGEDNRASGSSAAVSGGGSNVASGSSSSISGGYDGLASAVFSSTSGGAGNIASGVSASVVGGWMNIASGNNAVVSGGQQNVASAQDASVSGGAQNTASGLWSSILGGTGRTVAGDGEY